MTKLLFSFPQKSVYSEFGSREFQVLKATSPWIHFSSRGPTLSSGVLLVMHFGPPKLHFIRLEAWFYGNGTLKYDKVFVFYSPKELLFWIWLSRVPIFEGPMSVCPFHQHGPTSSSGVLLFMHFGTPKVHFIRLEACFLLMAHWIMTKFLFLIAKKSFYSEFGFCEFQFLKVPSLCALFISTGQHHRVVYCFLCILAPLKFISLG